MGVLPYLNLTASFSTGNVDNNNTYIGRYVYFLQCMLLRLSLDDCTELFESQRSEDRI